MGATTHSIEVNAPVRAVYNQWTQFEEFPRFMEGVEEVRQLEDRRLHWRGHNCGRGEGGGAGITEKQPDERVAREKKTGAPQAGGGTVPPPPATQKPHLAPH